MAITIVGLGPGEPKYLTDEAKQILSEKSCVYVRSSRDPSLSSIPNTVTVKSFDHLYEVEHAEGVYVQIAKAIIELSIGQDIVYAVPGDPRVGELSVGLILNQAKRSNIAVRIIHGISFFEPLFNAVGYDPFNGIQIIMADELVSQRVPNINPSVATLITMIIWPVTTSLIYEKLTTIYPATQKVIIVERAGTREEKCRQLTLEQLGQDIEVHPLSCIFIPKSGNPSFQQLINKIAKTDAGSIEISRKANKVVDFLASLDADSLGKTLRAALDDLPPDTNSHLDQLVRWRNIQYLIGRFIADAQFRQQYLQNPKAVWDEFKVSEKEQLLLSILSEWNDVVDK